MATRATWKGYLKLALVSCPIALYTATASNARVSFRQINRKTGNRIKQQLVDSVTGDVVAAEDKARGYETGKDQFLLVEDAEIETLRVESTHVIDIDAFVPATQIDTAFYDTSYYVAPDDKVGQDAFAIIREAMREKGMVGIGRVVLQSRERPIMLEAHGKGIRGITLRYPYELRSADGAFDNIANVEVAPDMLELASILLEQKATDFDPAQFVDRYEDALVELIKAKQAGQPVPKAPVAEKPANVVSLMDALRASVSDKKADAKPKTIAKAKPAKAAPAKRKAA